MWALPTTVQVLDREYAVRNKGDFKTILKIIKTSKEPDLNPIEREVAILCLFYDGLDEPDDVFNEFETPEYKQEAHRQLSIFISCGDADDCQGIHTRYPLMDWEFDEQLIITGINPQLGNGMDIRSLEYMHWWTFYSYYMGIGEGVFSTVVSIRDKIVKGKKKEKWEQQFIRDNPRYFSWREHTKSPEEKKLVQDIYELWNKK